MKAMWSVLSVSALSVVWLVASIARGGASKPSEGAKPSPPAAVQAVVTKLEKWLQDPTQLTDDDLRRLVATEGGTKDERWRTFIRKMAEHWKELKSPALRVRSYGVLSEENSVSQSLSNDDAKAVWGVLDSSGLIPVVVVLGHDLPGLEKDRMVVHAFGKLDGSDVKILMITGLPLR